MPAARTASDTASPYRRQRRVVDAIKEPVAGRGGNGNDRPRYKQQFREGKLLIALSVCVVLAACNHLSGEGGPKTTQQELENGNGNGGGY